MYTQCPECGVAFRVTAEVLKQAAGKVRCGGCGVAFNALSHLSERKPEAPVSRESEPEPQLPELTPDEPPELEADTPPQSISAEQSAALLKTLDQLAGSDIRIEDTGVEWRVLDTDDDAVAEADEEPVDEEALAEAEAQISVSDSDLIADTGSLKFFIADDQQDEPIDEVLEESPTPVDEFLTKTPNEIDAPEIFEEMRFDDNTPLPDDFDLDAPAAPPESLPVVEPEPVEIVEDAQVDLELGDPDEWEDLLGEVAEPAAEESPEEEPEEEEPKPEEIETGEAEPEADDGSFDDLVALSEAVAKLPSDEPLDMDTQFAIQAEAMGIDLSGLHEAIDEAEVEAETELEEDIDDELETSIDEDLIAAAFEAEEAAEEEVAEIDLEEEARTEGEEEAELEIELAEEDVDELIDELKDEAIDERSLAIKLDDELDIEDEDLSEASDIHDIPEMTEEEKTINMLIDQDLLSVAVEDEDGFASTIVQVQPDKKVEKEIEDLKEEPEPEPEVEDESADEPVQDKKKEKGQDVAPQLVETIIMEGEFVRDEMDRKRDQKNLALGENLKAKKAEAERLEQQTKARRKVMLAGAAGLVFLLVIQVLHQTRGTLATIPAFRDTVGPIYRMVGNPITPAYDVTGWRFEATKGSTDETDELLTIYSRVGNKSDKALPYPLIHVSLTDRFEEPIGSSVLEPAGYLAGNDDPRELVAAGNTFNAVITIASPAAEATGFKLNVCYRQADSLLRCADTDFK